MEKLPECVVLEILSRLDDSADVERCRLASWRTFNSVSRDLRSINLQWPFPTNYIQSRSRVSRLTSPLKPIFLNLLLNLRVVESVHIGVNNRPLGDLPNAVIELEDMLNDLHLTDGDFMLQWLPRVSGDLKSLSICDFWVQSCRRRSNVLSLVSAHCRNLLELELKNTRLSVNNLSQMQKLTTLKLESVILDDRVVSQLNKFFPNLQVLNLIDVSGFATIHHLNLKTCHCTLADPSPLSVIAPKLITLTLNGVSPNAVHVQAPMLSHLHLSIHHESSLTTKNLENLKTLWLETSHIYLLLFGFPFMKTVKDLTLDSRGSAEGKGHFGKFKFTLGRLFSFFPNVTSLCFKSMVWSEFEANRGPLWVTGGRMETFRGYLLMEDISLTLDSVAILLEECSTLRELSLLIHHDVASYLLKGFIRTCMARWPEVNWKWGIWEQGKEDSWLTDA